MCVSLEFVECRRAIFFPFPQLSVCCVCLYVNLVSLYVDVRVTAGDLGPGLIINTKRNQAHKDDHLGPFFLLQFQVCLTMNQNKRHPAQFITIKQDFFPQAGIITYINPNAAFNYRQILIIKEL